MALASLREGETVLDLGSGAGFDCFLAGIKVGETGKVIGVDMTPEMIVKARENAGKGNYQKCRVPGSGEIENLPVADNSADVIISNCVINLSPDKGRVISGSVSGAQTWGENDGLGYRFADGASYFINSVEGYIGCLSGAIMKEEYLGFIRSAGFQEVTILEETPFPIEYMENDPTAKAVLGDFKIPPEKVGEIESSVSSIKVYAVKPNDSGKLLRK